MIDTKDTPHDDGGTASSQPLYIETNRLSLRPVCEEHLTAFHAAASQREVADMLASIPHPLSLDTARDWLAARKYAGVPGFVAGIFLEDGTLIGCIGLSDYPRTVNYFIDPAHWGRGYATEALSAFLDWCAETFALDEYVVGVIDTNVGSCKVLEKVGFEVMYASRFQSDVRPTPDRLLIYWKGYGAERPLVRHTDRLFLSPLHLAHAKRLSELTDDADVASILDGVALPFTPENAQQWIKSAQEHERIHPMAIVLKEGRLIGAGYIEVSDEQGVIVIWIGCEHRGQGLGAEAYAGLVDLAFERFPALKTLEYVTNREDHAMTQLLEGAGFLMGGPAPSSEQALRQESRLTTYRLQRQASV